MKHKMSYPRGMFRHLYDRDANNLRSYLSSKCHKSFIMNLCSFKCQMSFIKSYHSSGWIGSNSANGASRGT